MSKSNVFLIAVNLLLAISFFTACEKEKLPQDAFPLQNTPIETVSIDYVTEGQPERFESGDRSDQEIQDRCCNISLTSFTNNGILNYAVKNPSVPLPYSRRRISVIDADYGGIIFQYSWGLHFSSCSNWNVKTHLGQIVQYHLSNCLNRYQALMELQIKQSNGSWVTCSSSLSPVFTLGTDPNCE